MSYKTKTMQLWNTTDDLIRFLRTPSAVTVRAMRPKQSEAPKELQDCGAIYLDAMRQLSAAQAGSEIADPALREQLNRLEAKLDALAGVLADKVDAAESADPV